MPRITRRKFLKDSAVAGVGTAFASSGLLSAPTILTRSRGTKFNGQGELIFRPHYVQSGRGPHLLDWAYASDQHWDSFHSNIKATRDGITISDTEGREK